MDTTLELKPCRLTPEMLDAPLPFDLYNSRGMLLVRKGAQAKNSTDHLLNQPTFRLGGDDPEVDDRQMLQRLETIYQRYGKLISCWNCLAADVRELKQQVSDLVHLCGSHSDLCVTTASHLPSKSNAVKHSFATAIVAILLGDALGWNLRRQHVLARAALTMNLSLLPLHDDWARSRALLSIAQKGSVHRHPGLSAELLLHSPGVDLTWVTAVDQHHENIDGSGYPLGFKDSEISIEARVLRVADAWCALVLPRSGKARKTPKDAMQEMNRFVSKHFDHQVLQALRKLMGAYPPGTFVRLANRETAIIMRWDKQGSAPKFATSVLSPTGAMPHEFKVRQLTQHGYEIRDYTYLDMAQMARFSIARIWASGAA